MQLNQVTTEKSTNSPIPKQLSATASDSPIITSVQANSPRYPKHIPVITSASKNINTSFLNGLSIEFILINTIISASKAPSVSNTRTTVPSPEIRQLTTQLKVSTPETTNNRLIAQIHRVRTLVSNKKRQSPWLCWRYQERRTLWQFFRQYQQNQWPQEQVMWQQPETRSIGIQHLGQLFVMKVMQMKVTIGTREKENRLEREVKHIGHYSSRWEKRPHFSGRNANRHLLSGHLWMSQVCRTQPSSSLQPIFSEKSRSRVPKARSGSIKLSSQTGHFIGLPALQDISWTATIRYSVQHFLHSEREWHFVSIGQMSSFRQIWHIWS